MSIPIYKIGDKVKIINYGHVINIFGKATDINKNIIGKIGIIESVIIIQDFPSYSIYGISEKHAWYNEGQLEMINANPNTL